MKIQMKKRKSIAANPFNALDNTQHQTETKFQHTQANTNPIATRQAAH